jgi:predicted transposase/invertase (TIGR01784 family)
MINENKITYKFQSATGALKFNMTNDYMFRIVLQKNNETLILLISSLLHIPEENISKAEIQNPVIPGESINEKEYHLDILVHLNDNTIINFEMQVVDYHNWPERSLSYLCRKYDNIAKGKDYIDVKPVYHIGFLDFTLFEDHPEFYAKYHVRNDKDGYLYTDKFHLYVVELNHTNLATTEDKAFKIDTWAKLFKATTWEDIKMITKKNPSMNSTAEEIYIANADSDIAEQCRIREDNIMHEKITNERLEALTKENALMAEEIIRLKKKLADNGID